MRRKLATMFCIVALVSACGGATHDTAADVAAIGKVRDAWTAAFKAGDASAIAALYTPDAQFMNNGQPTVTGPQGVESSMKATMGQMTSQSVVLMPVKTEVSGDLAYEQGTYTTTMTPKTGSAMTEEGRYLVVSKRQPDGSWKIAAHLSNLPTAPMPMPAAPAKPQAKKK